MKYENSLKLARYIFDNMIGNLTGFIIGLASTRLISHYFATRSIKNLWGLTSHKTVVAKTTYSNLEWIVSVLIGFLVFEVVSKWLKAYLSKALFIKKWKAITVRTATAE